MVCVWRQCRSEGGEGIGEGMGEWEVGTGWGAGEVGGGRRRGEDVRGMGALVV